ncbi:MAG: nitroreductase/dihydropteridine reductase [Candidatus Latescibacterota bacterium]|jgi:nitroreductase/dihydropteridine reductase
MNIIQSLKWRYATKKFDPSKVLSEEKLEVLKKAFDLTATSYGLQPIKLVVVSNSEVKKQLVPMTMGQEQVANASHVLILCIENKLDAGYIKEYFKKVEIARSTPRHILEPFESFIVNEFAEKTKAELDVWMSKQAYLALGNLLTICAIEGIDSCPMEGFDPQKYDEFLKLTEKGLTSVLVLPVGYRSKDDVSASLMKVRRGTEASVIEL